MPRQLQIGMFILIFGFFLFLFFVTQKSSLKSFVGLGPSKAPVQLEGITPIVPTTQQTNQQNQQQQQNQQATQQQQVAGADVEGPPAASISAKIKTTKGTITISLVTKDAPQAIQNFIKKAKSGFYTNLKFHRVEDWVIQGGDPTGTGTGGGAIQTELNQKPFTTGSVGYAASGNMPVGQGARISNDSQFFIVKQDADWLDGQYTNFATVTDGMDVVNRIVIGDKILSISVE